MSKIAIKSAEAGTATFTIEAPATNTNRVLELPDEAGKILTNATPGTVLQVVSATKTNTQSTNSLSFVDISGLSVSITPTSATSKFILISHVSYGSNAGVNGGDFLFVRNTSAIGIGDADGSKSRSSFTGRVPPSSGFQHTVSGTFLDEPNTTSSIIYKLQMRCKEEDQGSPGRELFINRSRIESNSISFSRNISTITVMEIAG